MSKPPRKPRQPRNEITVIESGAYREEQERLMQDPIIQDMAANLQADDDLTTFNFMSAASDEYHKRGGQAHSIGGPARAIRAIRGVPINTDQPEEAPMTATATPTETPAEAPTYDEAPAKPKRERKAPTVNLLPLKRPVKLTLPGATLIQSKHSKYVHVLHDGQLLCGLSANYKATAELTETAKINCPVCAKLQKA